MTEQAKKRRLQDTLSIAGSAVIAFSVWSLAKIGLFLMLANEKAVREILSVVSDSLSDVNGAKLVTVVYVVLAVIALIDLVVRGYIGMSARAEGRGKKKPPVYLVIALIVAMMNASSILAIAKGSSFSMSPFDMIVTIAIEATATAALVLVIYCSIRLRRMDKTTG